MSIDKSLVSRERLARHRNVLSRAERLLLLENEGIWQEGKSLFGLPKVKNLKAKRRAKGAEKKEEAAAAAAAEGEAPAAETDAKAPAKAAAKAPAKDAGKAPAKDAKDAKKEKGKS